MVQASLFDLSLLWVETVGGLRGSILMVGLIRPVVRQQRPDGAGMLVGQHYCCRRLNIQSAGVRRQHFYQLKRQFGAKNVGFRPNPGRPFICGGYGCHAAS